MADSRDFEGGLEVEEKTINWRIQEFDALRNFDTLIRKQMIEFSAGESIGLPTKWDFRLIVDELNLGGGNERWIGAHCRLLSKPENVTNVCAAFSLKIISDSNGKGLLPFPTKCFRDFGADPTNGYGPCNIIKAGTKLEDLPLDDEEALVLQIDFKLYGNKQPNLYLDQSQKFEVDSEKKFIDDITANYSVLTSDDTVLVSMDGVEFPSNRGILSARCSVFEMMFQTDMKELATGRVEIKDISSKTLGILHTYLLTGKLEATWKSEDIIDEFLYGIHKYQLDDLIDFVDKNLGKLCTKETAKVLAVLAEKFGMKQKERDLMEYMRKYAVTVEDITVVTSQPLVDAEGEEPSSKRFKPNEE